MLGSTWSFCSAPQKTWEVETFLRGGNRNSVTLKEVRAGEQEEKQNCGVSFWLSVGLAFSPALLGTAEIRLDTHSKENIKKPSFTKTEIQHQQPRNKMSINSSTRLIINVYQPKYNRDRKWVREEGGSSNNHSPVGLNKGLKKEATRSVQSNQSLGKNS